MQRLLITDLDNTLYNWIDYFGESFRGMIHALSRQTKTDEETIIKDFKEVFLERDSLEYAFSVQELNLCKSLSKEEILSLIKLAKVVFSKVRNKYLKPYENVENTLKWLSENGVLIVGVSMAPFYNAEIRLKQLKLDKYFIGLGAWEGPSFPINEYTEEISSNKNKGKYSSKIRRHWTFKKEQLKLYAYNTILSQLKISPEQTYIVGDSIFKDLKPAFEMGAKGIWAKYGAKYKEENLATVLQMTSWRESEIKKVFVEEHKEPDFIINSFDEIKHIIPINQLELFKES